MMRLGRLFRGRSTSRKAAARAVKEDAEAPGKQAVGAQPERAAAPQADGAQPTRGAAPQAKAPREVPAPSGECPEPPPPPTIRLEAPPAWAAARPPPKRVAARTASAPPPGPLKGAEPRGDLVEPSTPPAKVSARLRKPVSEQLREHLAIRGLLSACERGDATMDAIRRDADVERDARIRREFATSPFLTDIGRAYWQEVLAAEQADQEPPPIRAYIRVAESGGSLEDLRSLSGAW